LDYNRIEHNVHKDALLSAIESAIEQWPPDERTVPLPSVNPSDYVVLEPVRADWDVWPLTYRCSNNGCGRVRKFFRADQVAAAADPKRGLICGVCKGRLVQLPYFAAHACGQLQDLYTPKCSSCDSNADIFFEDTGSFETSSWRCRACGGRYVQGTRFVPCRCGKFKDKNGKSFMRLYTVRDRRSHYPHHISMVNLQSPPYQALQTHQGRAQVSLATYLGDEDSIARGLRTIEADATTERMTPEEWEKREAQLRSMDWPEEMIETLKREHAPIATGPLGINVSEAVEDIAASQEMLERAGLLDRSVLRDRRTLEQAISEADPADRKPLQQAELSARRLGIESLSVTGEFPVLLAAYGYTRQDRKPGKSTLMSFAGKNLYGGKTPVFAMAAETEALIVELSAKTIHEFLRSTGLIQDSEASSERDARLEMLEVLAGNSDAAQTTTTLVHSLSHLFLRSLDDGQSGFGESSLAEWISPFSLTFAVYVSSYQEFSIGAFWTLLHSRVRAWMERIEEAAFRCDNDPLCHNQTPRACERCLFLTFGCLAFNEDLSRTVVMDFFRFAVGRQ
jgi:hypothetical protein